MMECAPSLTRQTHTTHCLGTTDGGENAPLPIFTVSNRGSQPGLTVTLPTPLKTHIWRVVKLVFLLIWDNFVFTVYRPLWTEENHVSLASPLELWFRNGPSKHITTKLKIKMKKIGICKTEMATVSVMLGSLPSVPQDRYKEPSISHFPQSFFYQKTMTW